MHILVKYIPLSVVACLVSGQAISGFNSNGSFGDVGGFPPRTAAVVVSNAMAAPVMLAALASGTVTATKYFAVSASTPAAGNQGATDSVVQTPVPSPISVTGLNITSSVTMATGNWVFVIRKNGANTTVTCTLSSGTNCTDNFGTTGHSATFAVGDMIDVLGTDNSGTSAAFAISFLMRSTVGQDSPIFSGTGGPLTLSATATKFGLGLAGQFGANEGLIPQAGHIDDLQIYVSAAPGAGITSTVTVYYGTCGAETATSLTTSVTGASQVTNSDMTAGHGFDVAAGQCVQFQGTATGGTPASASVQVAVRWSPGSSGTNYYYPMFLEGTTLPTTVLGKWCGTVNGALCYGGAGFAPVLPDLTTAFETRAATAVNINALVNTGGTSGQARTWSLVAGAAGTSGNPTCTIAAAASACSASTGTAAMTIGSQYSVYNVLGTTGGTALTSFDASWTVGIQ